MNEITTNVIIPKTNIQYSECPTREPDGEVLSPYTCGLPKMDSVELSKRGIALSEKRQTAPFQRSVILKDNVIDNTDAYETFIRQQGEKNKTMYYSPSGKLIDGYISVSKNSNYKIDISLPLELRSPTSYHSFFKSDASFLIDAADEYAKIDSEQEFLWRPTQDDAFVKNTLEWLYGDEVTQKDIIDMHDQVDKIVRELSEQVKEGKNADFADLTNGFCFRGDEISVSSLMKAQKLTEDFMKVLNPGASGGGNDTKSFEAWARRGLVESFSNYYYSSLPGEIGKQFQAALDKVSKPIIENCSVGDLQINYLPEEAKNSVIGRHTDAYERFSSLTQSTLNDFNNSFLDQLSWYENTVNNVFHHKNYKDDTQSLLDIYNSVMQDM